MLALMQRAIALALIALTGCGASASAKPDGGTKLEDGATPDARRIEDSGPSDGGKVEAGLSTFMFAPASIPQSGPELSDPMRGQYLWLGVPAYPAGWPDVDAYSRWNWAQLETTEGDYQWAIIDAQIAAATARHGRFGMRVMALCQGCADHMYMGANTSIPDYLADMANPLIGSAPGDSDVYLIPDWNSTAYFTRLEALLSAIAMRYHDDPHFAWVDVSSYGNWGEMHLYPFISAGGPYDTSTQKPITDANAQKLVGLNATAFANKLLVVNSEQTAALNAAVASVTPPIGLRVDCLGSDDLAGGAAAIMSAPGAIDRWKTAPFITEWCQTNLGTSGADLFVQGEAQVRQYHVSMLSSGNFSTQPTSATDSAAFRQANVEAGYRLRTKAVTVAVSVGDTHGKITTTWVNDNVAPTYLAWQVVVGFRGATTLEVPLSLDLRKVLPGAPLTDDESVVLPHALESGTYEVYLRVDDSQKVSQAMQLAMSGQNSASGEYLLGSIELH
jgi:Domain of unknown function (DUF4832)